MLELKGKYCKDCRIFTDNIEQDALSMVYHFLADMVISQAYAEYNHKIIDRLVLEAIISGSGKKATIVEHTGYNLQHFFWPLYNPFEFRFESDA